MEQPEKLRRNFIQSILQHVINSLPCVGNIAGTSLMLIICGVTVGSLYPELKSGEVGPSIYSFLTGMGVNLFSGVLEKLRTKKDKNEPVTRQDIDSILEIIKGTRLDEQLNDESFQREIRNQFARLDIIAYLVTYGQQNTARFIIDALSTRIDLLNVNIVNSIDQETVQVKQLSEDVKKLTQAILISQGKRTTARVPAPPGRHMFISYSSADGDDLADKLHNYLESEGIEAWLDKYDIKPGDEWDTMIQAAIEDCQLFIFVVTPGSVRSTVCSNEWTYAISIHKPVILALWKDASIPLRLNRLQYIDFRPDHSLFMQGLAKLRLSYHEVGKPIISREKAIEQEGTASQKIEYEKGKYTNDLTFSHNIQIINPLPQNIMGNRFKNRDTDQAKIVNWLEAGIPIVGIYGRGGIGKTALACKVLSDLMNSTSEHYLHGIVYLGSGSGGATGISIERIFSDLVKLLSNESKEIVIANFRDTQSTTAQKTSKLLHLLNSRNFVLFLDNLENLQDPISHKLLDPELESFFEITAKQGRNLRILVTSRLPLKLSNSIASQERRISLSAGLPLEHAIALLIDLDEDGQAHLREAPQEKLEMLVAKTRGFPRALEAVVGFLKNSSLSGLDELLRNNILFSKEVTQIIVQQAIIRLSPISLQVMEGMAIFGRPVTEGAIEFLLAPFMDTSDLHDILDGLVRSYFISYNKATKLFSMHPIDQEYCYYRIPVGTIDDVSKHIPIYSRYGLHYRAAECYKLQRRPKDQWNDFSDIVPMLNEFDQHVICENYDSAASILLDVEYQFLSVQGHYNLAAKMFESLKNKIKDKRIEMECDHRLARSYYSVGKMQKSVNEDNKALSIAVSLNDQIMQATCLGGMGFSSSALGKPRVAMSYYERALKVLPAEEDMVGRAWYLNGMGISFFDLGQYSKAYEYYLKGYSIAPSEKDGRIVAAMCLGNAAESLIFLKEFNEAKKLAHKALQIANDHDYIAGLSYFNYYLALSEFYSEQPNLDAARISAENASKYNEPLLNHCVWVLLGSIILRQGFPSVASNAFMKAIEHADNLLREYPEDCNALDSKGVAFCGLTLCGETEALSSAKKILEKARKVSRDKGIVDQTLRLIEAISEVDKDKRLIDISAMMAQYF